MWDTWCRKLILQKDTECLAKDADGPQIPGALGKQLEGKADFGTNISEAQESRYTLRGMTV